MARKEKHGKTSIPTVPPPPPIQPLSRSQTVSSIDATMLQSPSVPNDTTVNESKSPSTDKKPPLAPKPHRFARALSGNSFTLPFRRKSKGEKREPEKEVKKEAIKDDTKEVIKEENEVELSRESNEAEKISIGEANVTKKESSTPQMEKKTQGESDTRSESEASSTPKAEKKPDQSSTAKREKKEKKKQDKKDSKKSQKKVSSEENVAGQSKITQLREAPLWRLPGMDKRRHSTAIVQEANRDLLPRPTTPPSERSTTAPELPTESKTLPRLRPLPEIPRELPGSLPHLPTLPETPPTRSKTPPSTHESPSSSLECVATPAKERKGSQASQTSSAEQKYTPPQGDAGSSGSPEPDLLPESISLSEMVKKYSKSFPLRIRVLQGYCSENSQVNISTDDVYNIHFMKHTKIVRIKDEDGDSYSIPLGSAMKFGLVYNPNNQIDEALTGFQFEKVADVTTMSVLPKVICATKAYQSSDEKTSVEENEMLAVRHVHKSMFKGKKGLKVFSLLTQAEKTLPDECAGRFSTKPSLVQMHLPEIIEYIPTPFPTHAVMYSGGDSAAQVPGLPGTLSRVINMCEYSTETSLVVSFASGEGEGEGSSEEQQLFDIPLDDEISDIEVALLESKDDDEHLYDDTVNILANFDPTKLQSWKGNESDGIFKSIREGFEKVGVNVEPQYENITKQPPLPEGLLKHQPPPLPTDHPLLPEDHPPPPPPTDLPLLPEDLSKRSAPPLPTDQPLLPEHLSKRSPPPLPSDQPLLPEDLSKHPPPLPPPPTDPEDLSKRPPAPLPTLVPADLSKRPPPPLPKLVPEDLSKRPPPPLPKLVPDDLSKRPPPPLPTLVPEDLSKCPPPPLPTPVPDDLSKRPPPPLPTPVPDDLSKRPPAPLPTDAGLNRNRSNGYDSIKLQQHDSELEGDYDEIPYDKIRQADPMVTCWMEDLQTATSALENRLRSLEHDQQSTDLNK